MSDVLNSWKIADGAVRLILLQTVPGRELMVGRDIEKRCSKIGLKSSDFKVFRILGDFDLAFIHDNAKLAQDDFVKLGTIPYITASSECVCHKCGNLRDYASSFDISNLAEPLLSICFLKINPAIIRKEGIYPEVEFVKYLHERNDSVQIIGTLGWFELILLLSKKSLNSILNEVHNELLPLVYTYSDSEQDSIPIGFAEKTISLIGHELDVSDQTVHTKRSTVGLFHRMFKESDLSVDLTLSCRPRSMGHLYELAHEHFSTQDDDDKLKIRMLYGPRDIYIDIPLSNINTFNHLLYMLDDFRSEAKDMLVKTHTHLQYQKQKDLDLVPNPEYAQRTPMFSISLQQAKELVEKSTETSELASAIYRYNNYIENSLIADAFLDLARYVKSTKDLALEICGQPSLETRQRIVDRLRVLREAIEQRSQGVYIGVDESPFALNATGIGLIRALKAMEAYVCNLLQRFDLKWAGFILAGSHSRYEHLEDVIIMPTNALLKAYNQWEITHETMHAFQYLDRPRTAIENVLPTERDKRLNRYTDLNGAYWQLIHEMFTDMLDFAICCPLNIKDYTKVVWSYLQKAIFRRQDIAQLRSYLYRSFAVILYNKLKEEKEIIISDELRKRMKTILLDAISLINDSNNMSILDTASNENNSDIVYEDYVLDFIVDMGNAIPYMITRTADILENSEPISMTKKNINTAINRLKQGKILSVDIIRNPESIAWTIAASYSEGISDSASIAWILSLWNMYYINKYNVDID